MTKDQLQNQCHNYDLYLSTAAGMIGHMDKDKESISFAKCEEFLKGLSHAFRYVENQLKNIEQDENESQ